MTEDQAPPIEDEENPGDPLEDVSDEELAAIDSAH